MSHTRLERLLEELRGSDDQDTVLEALTTALLAHRTVCGSDDELEQEIGWLRIGLGAATHEDSRDAVVDELERLLVDHVESCEAALPLPQR